MWSLDRTMSHTWTNATLLEHSVDVVTSPHNVLNVD